MADTAGRTYTTIVDDGKFSLGAVLDQTPVTVHEE
jgi:hypothetical protein